MLPVNGHYFGETEWPEIPILSANWQMLCTGNTTRVAARTFEISPPHSASRSDEVRWNHVWNGRNPHWPPPALNPLVTFISIPPFVRLVFGPVIFLPRDQWAALFYLNQSKFTSHFRESSWRYRTELSCLDFRRLSRPGLGLRDEETTDICRRVPMLIPISFTPLCKLFSFVVVSSRNKVWDWECGCMVSKLFMHQLVVWVSSQWYIPVIAEAFKLFVFESLSIER